MKKGITYWCLCLFLLVSATEVFADEQEDFLLIQQAYQDQLYLLVERKSEKFLSNPSYKNIRLVEKIKGFLIGGVIERGKYEKALERIVSFEKTHPSSHNRAEIEYDKARVLFEGYVAKDIPMPEAFAKQKPAEIILAVESQLNASRRASAEFIKGQDFFYRGDTASYSSALRAFMKIEHQYKSAGFYEEALFYLGKCHYYLNQYSNSLAVFNKLILNHKRSVRLADYFFWKGECLFELDKLKSAEMAFATALLESPSLDTQADVLYNVAWLYAQQGRRDQAIDAFRKIFSPKLKVAAERYADSARYKMGLIFIQEGEYRQCLAEVLLVRKNLVLKHQASLLAAQAYYGLKEWDEAVSELLVAEKSLIPDVSLEAKKTLALVYYEQKAFSKSLRILNRLITLEVPLDYKIDIQLQIAEVSFAKGDIYEAQYIYRELLAEEDESMTAGLHFKLAKCAMRTNPLVEDLYRIKRRLKLSAGAVADEKFLKKLSMSAGASLERVWNIKSGINRKLMLKVLGDILGESLDKMGSNAEVDAYLKKAWNRKSGQGRKRMLEMLAELLNKNPEDLRESSMSLRAYFEKFQSVRSYLDREEMLKTLCELLDKDLGELKEKSWLSLKKIEDLNNMTSRLLGKLRNNEFKSRIQVMVFNELREKFVKNFEKNTLPKYPNVIPKLKSIAGYYPTLKRIEIRNHLDSIVQAKAESPFLGLAHYEKAKLHRRENDEGSAIDSYKRAIASTGDPNLKAKYSFEMAHIQYKMAKVNRASTDREKKVHQVKSALESLAMIEQLSPNWNKDKRVSLEYHCFRLIQDNIKAEEVLLNYLRVAKGGSLDMVEKDLVSFYLDLNRPIKAAQRKQISAERILKDNPTYAHQLTFEAAQLLIDQGDEPQKKDGENLLIELSLMLPYTDWTLRASLESMEIYDSRGESKKASELAAKFGEPDDLSPEMALEKEMALAFHEKTLMRTEHALKRYHHVMTQAPSNSPLRSRAYLEYANLLKKSQPEKASEVFYDFYHLFASHPKREAALYECCRLRIRSLPKEAVKDDDQESLRAEIRVMISMLNNDEDRKSLSQALLGIKE